MKDELSRRFGLRLMRVQAEDLRRSEWQHDELTALIERWFEDHSALSTGVVNMQAMPKCPLCGGEMQKKPGKFGPFLSCIHYPDCKGSCDLPGTPNRIRGPLWRKLPVAIMIVIFAAILVAVAVVLVFQFRVPNGGGQQPPHSEAAPTVPGPRSAMTIEEQRAYASALKPSDYPACPLCGKRMVLRYNATTGGPFFGCSEFPRCRGSRDVPFPR